MVKIPNLNKIGLIGLVYITVMNLLSIAIRGASFVYLLTFVAPFIAIIIILLAFPKYYKQINSSLLFIIGLVMSAAGSTGNFSGIMFMIFAVHLRPERNRTIIRMVLIAVTIAVKSLIIHSSHIQIMNLLFMHYFCFVIYYVIMTEKKVVTIKEIEDQTEQIIDYLIEGFEIKEIAIKTCLTPAAVSKRINRLRDREGCRTTYQLIYKLSEYRQNSKKIDRFKII